MIKQENHRYLDLLLVSLANLMNLLMVVVFLARVMNVGRMQFIGFVWEVFVLLLGYGVVINIKAKRGGWAIALPLSLFIFLIVEILLDYIFEYDFRSTGWLGPYLLFYYVSTLAMIGYSFLVRKQYGFITLVTYFLSQIAAVVSYIKVGHG
jgi:hypothetical protein